MATATASKLGIRPLNDRIIVRRLEAEEKTAGGIVLPDTAKEKPKQGVVLAVGPGKVNAKGKRTELTVKVDDKVLFSSYAGTEIKVDGQDLLIMTEDEVLAIVNK